MNPLTLLATLFIFLATGKKPSRQAKASRPAIFFRPELQQLEDRTLLNTYLWVGNDAKAPEGKPDPGKDWSVAANWWDATKNEVAKSTPGQNPVKDIVIFDPDSRSEKNVNVNVTANVTVTELNLRTDYAGTITINASTTLTVTGKFNDITSQNAKIGGPGTFRIGDNISALTTGEWTGGSMVGQPDTTAPVGTTEVNNNAILTIDGSVTLNGRVLVINKGGVVELNSGQIAVEDGQIINRSTGKGDDPITKKAGFILHGGTKLKSGGGSKSSFTNEAGARFQTDGANIASPALIEIPFNNQDKAKVDVTVLLLTGGGNIAGIFRGFGGVPTTSYVGFTGAGGTPSSFVWGKGLRFLELDASGQYSPQSRMSEATQRSVSLAASQSVFRPLSYSTARLSTVLENCLSRL